MSLTLHRLLVLSGALFASSKTLYDVVVIGAGASGIAAASQAVSRGFSVLILEGRNRTGGRVWSTNAWGQTVELGAQWIHGVNGNPMTELATRFKVPCITSNYENKALWNGTAAPYVLLPNAGATEDRLYKNFVSSCVDPYRFGQQDAGKADFSLQAAVDHCLAQGSYTAAQKQSIQYQLLSVVEQEEAADASWLSAYNYDAGNALSGSDCQPVTGYVSIINSVLNADVLSSNRATLLLNQTVTSIDYRGLKASPAYAANISTLSKGAPAFYLARSVIVSVPLGVLKAGSIKFNPALPNDRAHLAHWHGNAQQGGPRLH